MNLLRAKLPTIAATALLTASLSLAQTDPHPKPVHHKAPKAQKHQAPKATAHPAPKATKHKAPSAGHRAKSKKHPRGQAAIDNQRASQIQEALVREHYLSGKPSGTWDSSTQEAMRRYQSDHGWQNKTVPDSRALISLGLGPDHEHLLNPETAMTTEPQLPHASGSSRSKTLVPAAQGESGVPTGENSATPVTSQQDSSSISAPANLSGSH
jgi:peptidoglycan hydrolase-like protein with peptidoglycan-binding domain